MRLKGAAIGLVLSCSVLTSCSSSHQAAGSLVTYSEGPAPGHTLVLSTEAGLPPPEVSWAAPGLMYLTTWGSSGCPRLPKSITRSGMDEVIVTTHVVNQTPGSNACAADLVADTSTVRLPPGVDRTSPLSIKVDDINLRLDPIK